MAVFHQPQQSVGLLLHVGQLGLLPCEIGTPVTLSPHKILIVAFDRQFEHLVGEQLLLQPREHALFKAVDTHEAAVHAQAAVGARRATHKVLCRDVVLGTAATAVHQAGQQPLRPALRVDFLQWHTTKGPHPLRLVPDVFVDDAHVRRILPLPFTFRVEARHPLTRGRFLDEPLPVVDDHAVVQLIVEQAIAPLVRTDQRRQVPFAARRPPFAFQIEGTHDAHRAFAADVFGIDAAHDGRFLLVDDAAATVIDRRDHVIAIAFAAGDAPSLDASHLSSPGLLREVLQEHCRHRALEANVHLVDEAVGQRFEAHAKEIQALIECRDVSLVARQPVEAFCNQHLHATARRIIHEPLQTGAVDDGRAGDGRIFVDRNLLQAASIGVFLRHRHLIGDRAPVLQVTRKSRIDCRTHRFTPLG